VGSLHETSARFYAACVCSAFVYLHDKKIVYRDLKPENLMLDSHGYCKVVDFGFAKVITERTATFCGTPEYVAPEIIAGTGHGMPVDWWMLGILLYEMLVGTSPFVADDQMKIFENITARRLSFPWFFEWRMPFATKTIHALLAAEPSTRLGSLSGSTYAGSREVRDCDFFALVDFAKLERKELEPPFMPNGDAILEKDDDEYDDESDDDDEDMLNVMDAKVVVPVKSGTNALVRRASLTTRPGGTLAGNVLFSDW